MAFADLARARAQRAWEVRSAGGGISEEEVVWWANYADPSQGNAEQIQALHSVHLAREKLLGLHLKKSLSSRVRGGAVQIEAAINEAHTSQELSNGVGVAGSAVGVAAGAVAMVPSLVALP